MEALQPDGRSAIESRPSSLGKAQLDKPRIQRTSAERRVQINSAEEEEGGAEGSEVTDCTVPSGSTCRACRLRFTDTATHNAETSPPIAAWTPHEPHMSGFIPEISTMSPELSTSSFKNSSRRKDSNSKK